jgi:glycosyltransferase involved in cell wall biosynthesis
MEIGAEIKRLQVVIVIPTYNNAAVIEEVIRQVASLTHDVIIINDGSTDNTSDILNRYASVCHICGYKRNKGKAYALRTAFHLAHDLGYRYALTMDADGQHTVSPITDFLTAVREHPDSLIVGVRPMVQEGKPQGNTFANRFSNFWYYLQTGLPLADTQSGFRLYPLLPLCGMHGFCNRYEGELEMLVRSAWRGLDVVQVPIEVHYPADGKRITHFRPFIDFARISLLNVVLTFLALAFYRPKMCFKHPRLYGKVLS